MTSKQRRPLNRLENLMRSGNGKQSAIAHNGSTENPVFRSLRSKSKRFPIDLLPGLVSSPLSRLERSHPVLRSIEHPGVVRCLKLIARNPCLKLRNLTNISGLSRRGLHKAFRRHLGCTPGTVVTMVRLWTACDLLLANSTLSVDKIAMCCGYENSNSLYVAFRHYLEMTPLSVRRQSPLYDRGITKGQDPRNRSLPSLFSNRDNNIRLAPVQLTPEKTLLSNTSR